MPPTATSAEDLNSNAASVDTEMEDVPAQSYPLVPMPEDKPNPYQTVANMPPDLRATIPQGLLELISAFDIDSEPMLDPSFVRYIVIDSWIEAEEARLDAEEDSCTSGPRLTWRMRPLFAYLEGQIKELIRKEVLAMRAVEDAGFPGMEANEIVEMKQKMRGDIYWIKHHIVGRVESQAVISSNIMKMNLTKTL